jgi:hypothetical protein
VSANGDDAGGWILAFEGRRDRRDVVLAEDSLQVSVLNLRYIGGPGHLSGAWIFPPKAFDAVMLWEEAGANRGVGGRGIRDLLPHKGSRETRAPPLQGLQIGHGGEVEVVGSGTVKNDEYQVPGTGRGASIHSGAGWEHLRCQEKDRGGGSEEFLH